MRNLYFDVGALLILASVCSGAKDGTERLMNVATGCYSREDAEQLQSFGISDDVDGAQALIAQNRCATALLYPDDVAEATHREEAGMLTMDILARAYPRMTQEQAVLAYQCLPHERPAKRRIHFPWKHRDRSKET